MAKIRVYELAEKFGRENKEVLAVLQRLGVEAKSHMSIVEEADAARVRAALSRKPAKSKEEENMQENSQKEQGKNPVRKAEGEAQAPQPKKKNIIQVFRPQNSKTGMVKPGSRPRPQGQPRPGARPQGAGQPGARPQGRPGARPQQPGTRMAGQEAVRPQGQPGSRVPGQEAVRPQGQPGMRAPGQEAARMHGQPGTKAPGQESIRMQSQPGTKAPGQEAARMQSQPGTKAPGQEAAKSQSLAGTRLPVQDGAKAPSQAAHVPQAQESPKAQSQAAVKPQSQENTKPQSQTAAEQQSQDEGKPHVQTAKVRTQETAKPQAPADTGVRPVSPEKSQAGKAHGEAGVQENRTQSQRSQPQNTKAQNQGGTKSQGGRTQGDGQSNQKSGSQNRDRRNQGQGGRYQDDGQNRGQGGRYRDGGSQSRSQGGGQDRGTGRGQGGGQDRGQNRGQGGRYQDGGQDRGQNRGQGGRYQDGSQNRGAGSRGQGGRPVNIPKAPTESKPLEKESRKRTERGDRNRNDKGEKLERMEKNVRQNQKNAPRKGQQAAKAPAPKPVEKPEETIRNIIVPEKLTISELASLMKVQPSAIVKKLFLQGTMVTINQEVDYDTAEEIALEFNCICEKEVKVNVIEELLKEEADPEETLVPRPPVICVMGHVDHGKTSLLDAIRNTHVIDKEAGGITQHIGAYVVSINGEKITFLDTPGHEAFTAMRMRGANSTDIAILVVAADDGVMPQTVEAINHAKAAGIEIIVAINKIDKPSANVERVKQELSEYGLIPEDWGGSTVFVPVSAHTHEGLDNLLEMILLTAEVCELRANPKRRARGIVIEAQLDKGKGPVATVLVQKGTLHTGEPIAAGSCHGKIRAMMDDKGRRVKEAGPSTPVEILGFSDVPNAGETFLVMETEKEARNFAETFIREGRERLLEDTKQRMSLDDLFSQIQAGSLKELDIIVKADVQGSVEAIKQSLLKLSNDEVVVKIIHGGVGAINESDVILASASNAIIIGFNVRPDAMAKSTAERENVDVRLYRVIYDAIADVEAAMKGMLDPIYEEKIIGHVEVRQIFKASGVGTIAGGYVTDGIIQRGCKVRISREGSAIYEGSLASLKRFKDDVKEVRTGYECGFVCEKFNDIREEDVVEAYVMVEVPR